MQAQVKKTKAKFDKLKLDTMQKIDLLAASRSNIYSHVLANYQTTLLQFWEKTSRTMSAVAESFKGYQYYEFNMLKVLTSQFSLLCYSFESLKNNSCWVLQELTEPSKKLAEETSNTCKDREEAGDSDGLVINFVSLISL